MSREVKFRIWDKTSNRMLYQDDFERVELDTKNKMVSLVRSETIESSYVLDYEDGIEAEIMQYTGLKDKNGKEIYEGDILERKFKGLGYELGDRTLVSWDKYRYVHIWKMEFERELKNNQDLGRWFKSRKISELDLDAHIKDFEVTGNIYENPELLRSE